MFPGLGEDPIDSAMSACQHREMKTRRSFLGQSSAVLASLIGLPALAQQVLQPEGENINFGLCTYMWGAEWDLPMILTTLKQLGIKGVELRVDHAHKVSPELTAPQRADVRQKFEESEITLIGMGTNADFDSPDPGKLKANIELAKEYIRLSHDIGGSGVKVKPNNVHEKEGISLDRTLEQIGKALAELGEYSIGFGQEIRLEVHGSVGKSLANIAKIMEVAKADNVRVCWNSNPTDLDGEGLEKNFGLIKEHLGHTTHIHELGDAKYPYDKLFKLFVEADYDGWMLMEANSKVDDKVRALGQQKELWTTLMETARRKA